MGAIYPRYEDDCESFRRFVNDDGNGFLYISRCCDQLSARVLDTCRERPTIEEQHQCGKEIAARYNHIEFRYGQSQCSGIADLEAWSDCAESQGKLTDNVLDQMWENLDRVRVEGDQDPLVIQAKERFIACMEDMGYQNVHWRIMLWWQGTLNRTLAGSEWQLANEIFDPARKCGDRTGLFEAQRTPRQLLQA